MMFYHRTSRDAADSIMRDGFRDGTGSYMTGREHHGVFISDRPLDANEGADGDVLLAVELDDAHAAELSQYEWTGAHRSGYREWCVPAALVNSPRARVRVEEEWAGPDWD